MKKGLALGIVTLAAAGTVGVSALSVSAVTPNGNGNGTGNGMHRQDGTGGGNGNGGGRQSSLESRAKVVGMTAAELEKALETKTMSQIAKDRGMTEAQFEAKMAEAAKARWQARGLSADEIATRTAEREKRQVANQADHTWGSGEGNPQGGYGRNR